MTTLLLAIGVSLALGAAFMLGVYVGIKLLDWRTKTVEKPVIVEKPVYKTIEKTVIQQAPKAPTGGTVVHKPDTYETKTQREEAQRLGELLNDEPEM